MAGDICLQAVARALVGQTGRAGDMLARYGGEEFAMLLPGADLDQARAAAERLCQAVRELGIEHEHGCACGVVSISVGVASLHPARQGPITGQPRSGVDVAQKLFQQADTALYCAKHRGRDQVADFCADCDQVLHDPPDSLFAPGP
jgi:diguanylate cyclase (GGDEF)-like protein